MASDATVVSLFFASVASFLAGAWLAFGLAGVLAVVGATLFLFMLGANESGGESP